MADNGISDHWRLCDDLTLKQAALLILGIDPDSETGFYCEGWKPTERPAGYGPLKQALCKALSNDGIKGDHYEALDTDWNGNNVRVIEGTTGIDRSTVDRDSLSDWLKSRGVKTGFFFPGATDTPDYLDPNHPRYAAKLAAAAQAWQAVTDPKGKSPKQALMKWLREHAAEFELSDDEGKPNETGIWSWS